MFPLQAPRSRANPASLASKVYRVLWWMAWLSLYRPTPRFLHAWRALLLRTFGATVGRGVHVYPKARIWAPCNLRMGDRSCLADGVNCYSVAEITLGEDTTISQGAHLCSASHDYTDVTFPLVAAPIAIGRSAWVAADAFIGPGVEIGEGAVVGARAVIVRDVQPWTVVAGNPARVLKARARPS